MSEFEARSRSRGTSVQTPESVGPGAIVQASQALAATQSPDHQALQTPVPDTSSSLSPDVPMHDASAHLHLHAHRTLEQQQHNTANLNVLNQTLNVSLDPAVAQEAMAMTQQVQRDMQELRANAVTHVSQVQQQAQREMEELRSHAATHVNRVQAQASAVTETATRETQQAQARAAQAENMLIVAESQFSQMQEHINQLVGKIQQQDELIRRITSHQNPRDRRPNHNGTDYFDIASPRQFAQGSLTQVPGVASGASGQGAATPKSVGTPNSFANASGLNPLTQSPGRPSDPYQDQISKLTSNMETLTNAVQALLGGAAGGSNARSSSSHQGGKKGSGNAPSEGSSGFVGLAKGSLAA